MDTRACSRAPSNRGGGAGRPAAPIALTPRIGLRLSDQFQDRAGDPQDVPRGPTELHTVSGSTGSTNALPTGPEAPNEDPEQARLRAKREANRRWYERHHAQALASSTEREARWKESHPEAYAAATRKASRAWASRNAEAARRAKRRWRLKRKAEGR